MLFKVRSGSIIDHGPLSLFSISRFLVEYLKKKIRRKAGVKNLTQVSILFAIFKCIFKVVWSHCYILFSKMPTRLSSSARIVKETDYQLLEILRKNTLAQILV